MFQSALKGSFRTAEVAVLLLCLLLLLVIGYGRESGRTGESYLYPAADRLHLYESRESDDLSRRLPSIKSLADSGITLVPNLAPASLPGDIGEINGDERKTMFVRALLPHLVFQNSVIASDRASLTEYIAKRNEGTESRAVLPSRIRGLFRKYRLVNAVSTGFPGHEAMERLLMRVDGIPVSMALAQAANESGWGASRFAREGNNIFGQWKFGGSDGMVPEERPEGATYSLAVFPNISVAVERYFLNLNTHRAYEKFRLLRAGMRRRGMQPDPRALATTLGSYSERGEDYVLDLIAIIRQNHLVLLDRAALVSASHTRGVFATLYLPRKLREGTVVPRSGGSGKV